MRTTRAAWRAPMRIAALAVTTLALVGVGGIAQAGSPTAADSTAAVTAKAKKGTLDWGVKQSFRDYIEGAIAQGYIEVTKPAKRLADGTFRFKKGKGHVDVDADTATIQLKGMVEFWGHEGALEIYLENPRLVLDGSDTGLLYVDARSRDMSTGEMVEYNDVALATVDAAGLDLTANKKGVVKVKGLATVMTEEGAPVLSGFYPAGTPLDPLSFKVKARG